VDDLFNRRVSDLVADNGACHHPESLVSRTAASARQIEILVGLQRVVLVDGPFDHGLDLETLHLFGDLLSGHFDLDQVGWEGGHLVVWSTEASQTDASLDLFASLHDDSPLVGLAHDAQRKQVGVNVLGQLVQVVAKQ